MHLLSIPCAGEMTLYEILRQVRRLSQPDREALANVLRELILERDADEQDEILDSVSEILDETPLEHHSLRLFDGKEIR